MISSPLSGIHACGHNEEKTYFYQAQPNLAMGIALTEILITPKNEKEAFLSSRNIFLCTVYKEYLINGIWNNRGILDCIICSTSLGPFISEGLDFLFFFVIVFLQLLGQK